MTFKPYKQRCCVKIDAFCGRVKNLLCYANTHHDGFDKPCLLHAMREQFENIWLVRDETWDPHSSTCLTPFPPPSLSFHLQLCTLRGLCAPSTRVIHADLSRRYAVTGSLWVGLGGCPGNVVYEPLLSGHWHLTRRSTYDKDMEKCSWTCSSALLVSLNANGLG